MAGKKYIELNNGQLAQKQATVVSSGAGNDGDLVALDSTGRLDLTTMPVGIAPDVAVATATESLNAGDYVNIYNNAGTVSVRKADNSNGRDAHGFVKSAFSNGATVTIYFEGANDALSGLTPGARQYLATAGGHTATAPTAAGGAVISQFLGIAVSTTAINTDIDDSIGLV